MHIDFLRALAGLVVGFTVGLTGMGGGALMTPILVLLFGINPGTAVSSDLLTSLVMKPVGGTVHYRRGTIDWALVRWLCLGSAPAAFAGVFVLRQLGTGALVQSRIQSLLGWALIVAAVAMIAKAWVSARRHTPDITEPVDVKRVGTLLIGAVGGFLVGMTSVGSGSLMMVMLLLLYPRLSAKRLVGTDLVQAIPLIGAATLSHALLGHIDAGLTGSLLVGSLPGVYLGARVSSRAPDTIVRPALIVVLLASALKLLGLQTNALGGSMAIFVLVGLPLWAATAAAQRPDEDWVRAGRRRTPWIVGLCVTAPFGVGFVVALVYFKIVRPALTASPPSTSLTAAPAAGLSAPWPALSSTHGADGLSRGE